MIVKFFKELEWDQWVAISALVMPCVFAYIAGKLNENWWVFGLGVIWFFLAFAVIWTKDQGK